MAEAIPFERLGIPEPLRPRIQPDAAVAPKLAIARGLLPSTIDVLLAVCYALVGDPNPEVADAARRTIIEQPARQVAGALTERTHPKILEFLAEFRPPDPELDGRLLRLRALNTRTARILARRADTQLCDDISRNHERLLLSPEILLDLHANPNASDAILERAIDFLRLEAEVPALPPVRPFLVKGGAAAPEPLEVEPPPRWIDIDPVAEVESALEGRPSPALEALAQAGGLVGAFADRRISGDIGKFEHDFYDEADFSEILIRDYSDLGGLPVEERKSLVRLISEMSVAQKIKLAYLGNKEARAILIRDRVKSVPVAVIRSGRCTDAEAISFAGDRNLPRDVIREIAISKEFTRKYSVKLALINNPKTPLAVAMGFLKDLTKKDLTNVGRNKNISSALKQTAFKMSRANLK